MTYASPSRSCSSLEQIQDLRADRDVQRRHRLVQDDELRVRHEGAGDGDALPLAAAELVRVERGALPSRSPTSSRTSPTRSRISAAAHAVPRGQRLGDDVLDPHPRIQRAVRVLEHRLDRAAIAREVVAAEGSMSLPSNSSDPPVGRSRSRKSLARVVLPDPDSPTMPEGLALGHLHAHPVHRLDPPAHAAEPKPPVTGKCFVSSIALQQSSGLSARAADATQHARHVAVSSAHASGGYASSQMGCRSGHRGAKGQPGGSCARSGGCPPISTQLLAPELHVGQAAQERPGVGMARVVEDLERAPHLHDPPRVHHRHAVGIGGHDAEVVGDQDDRDAGRAPAPP